MWKIVEALKLMWHNLRKSTISWSYSIYRFVHNELFYIQAKTSIGF